MRTHKVSVVFNSSRKQYRIALPRHYCKVAHIQKKDKILLISNETYPYFFVLVPEILYDRMPYFRERIEEFLGNFGNRLVEP